LIRELIGTRPGPKGGSMAILADCPICHHKQSARNKKCKCGKNLDKAKEHRKVKYWLQYRLPDGRQKKESVGSFEGLDAYSIKDANDAHSKRMVQRRERRLFDSVPESEMTFNDLAKWFLDLKNVQSRAYYKGLKRNIEQFNAVHGGLFIDQIKPVDLEIYQMDLIEKCHSDSYVDQKIGSVKTTMNKAFDNDRVSGATIKKFKKIKKILKRNSNARDRVLSSDEFDRLMLSLSKLQKARYLQAIVARGYADLFIQQVAGRVFCPGVAGQLVSAYAGIAAADSAVIAGAAASLHGPGIGL
jgi:dGTP triphosphohydrolase